MKNLSIYSDIESKLIGDPAETSVEQRIFNTVALLVFAIGVATTVNNIILGLNWYHVLLTLFVMATGMFVYLSALKTKSFDRLASPLSYTLLIIIATAWIVDGGSHGSSGYEYMLLAVSTTMYMQGWKKTLFLSIVLLSLIGLLALEWNYPNLIFSNEQNRIQTLKDKTTTLLLCLGVIWLIVNIAMSQMKRDKQKLTQAMEEIKNLRGIIPICVQCKKIRDDQGFWNQLEKYISEHADVNFTHSLCPDCLKKLYGFDESKMENNNK